jgi:hypothetical protein
MAALKIRLAFRDTPRLPGGAKHAVLKREASKNSGNLGISRFPIIFHNNP